MTTGLSNKEVIESGVFSKSCHLNTAVGGKIMNAARLGMNRRMHIIAEIILNFFAMEESRNRSVEGKGVDMEVFLEEWGNEGFPENGKHHKSCGNSMTSRQKEFEKMS